MSHSSFPSTFQLTVEAYHLMREVGILAAKDRVELIRGQIIPMSPKGSKHSNVVNRLSKALTLEAEHLAEVHNQNPIHMGDHSEPEPDLALLIPPLSRYEDRLPRPEDVLLVIEVADSSLVQDRQIKTLLYGEANIPEYWIVNLQAEEIEVYQQAFANGYKVCTRYHPGEQIPVAELGFELSVAEILGG
jgi:Uma2 family endonuclease